MSELKIGSVVMLKSNSHKMTVTKVNSESVECVWFVEGKTEYGNFPTDALRESK